jgi:hypothetical protein
MMNYLTSVEKLKIQFLEEENGSGTIHIDWDDTDPDLQWWNDLGEPGQKSFILDALQQALDCDVN